MTLHTILKMGDPRRKHIRYQGFDVYGNPIDRVAEGFHACVVQHECNTSQAAAMVTAV